ncbi:MAG: hypothetical protein R2799_14215 [Crocinitomicaceae bacterium]
MKRIVITASFAILCLSTPALFAIGYKVVSTNISLQETEIRVFTFEMNSESDRKKVEDLFSDQSKFVRFEIKSNIEVTVYTDEELSYEAFNELLVEIGIRTKTLQMQAITKSEYYNRIK